MAGIYLDNAATTPLDPEVLEAMMPHLQANFGNASSIHHHGRQARSAVEKARKQVAELLNAAPAEIFFTSGGTESDNTAMAGALEATGIRRVISSPLEHHAVLHPLEHWAAQGAIALTLLQVNDRGDVDLDQLENLLKDGDPALVSLMHANNEVGNITDMGRVVQLCQEHGAVLHTDAVQTVGHLPWDVQATAVHSLAASAHKFHGPKGVGVLYVAPGHQVAPYIHGGAQERNMRGGTENVAGIVGLAKALELATSRLAEDKAYIEGLKKDMIKGLQEHLPSVDFNGRSAEVENSLYTVLSVSLPEHADSEMLLFNLDIEQVSASAGSACSSGSQVGSHVLAALGHDPKHPAVRFSFSKMNTGDEVRTAIEVVAKLFAD